MRFFNNRRIETGESADHKWLAWLLGFRSSMSDPNAQIVVPAIFQLYMTLALFFGFYFRKEILWLCAVFVVLDLLTFAVSYWKQSMVVGQVMCAVNLLVTAGVCGQSVFAKRFPAYGGTVSGVVRSTGLNVIAGVVFAALVWGICLVLRRLWNNAESKTTQADTKRNGLKGISNFLLFAFIAACVVFAAIGEQWISIGPLTVQPGEFLKFAFLFCIAFISGIPDELMSFKGKMFREVIAFGVAGVFYASQSEFGTILILLAAFAFFLLVSHRNWIAVVCVLLVVAVLAAGVLCGVIYYGNIYIEEAYGAEQVDEFEADLNGESVQSDAQTSELTGGEETKEKKNKFVGREYSGPVQKVVDLFTENYDKIYFRYMVVKDINGTDPDTLPGVREKLRTESSFQAAAALDAIGISRVFPCNAPIFNYVPVGASDYVYTSVLQCGGLVAVFFMLFAYLLLADSAFALIATNSLSFNRNLVFVMISSILIQMFINILGVNNIIPLTGITLPFVSSGGSSFSVCLMMLGCMIWADVDYYKQKEHRRNEWVNNDNVKGGVLVNESADIRFE